MYSQIKTFTDNNPNGTQYLFTKADFYLLESWALWTVLTHSHAGTLISGLTDSLGTSAKLSADNVIIHKDAVHGTTDRPVGWEDSTSVELLTVEDHVSNTAIHTFNEGSEDVAAGTLIAVGWSKPIKVRAIISSPLFELMGHTRSGPAYMPFPTYNMSPLYSVAPNVHNQFDFNQDRLMLYPYRSASGIDPELLTQESNKSQGGFTGTSVGYTSEYLAACGSNAPHRSVEMRSHRLPNIMDGKNRTNNSFDSTHHNFLYLIPPYLYSPLSFSSEFDSVVSNYDANDISILMHTPLFVDSRHTKLLDRIQRSGITEDSLLNFRDLMGVYNKDTDKNNLFNSQADHTCWLSKYNPIATQSEDGSFGYGASLLFTDFQQEINQFVSQVNYGLESLESINSTYADYPFKVVNVNFNVYENILEDPSLYWFSQAEWDAQTESAQNEAIKNIIDGIVKRGFPYCFTRTDYSNVLVEPGGHNYDTYRPNENYFFNVYVNGLAEYKAWYYYNYAVKPTTNNWNYTTNVVDTIKDLIDENKYWSRYDFLNIPHGFDDGIRQVLILKDPNLERTNLIFKENPAARHRMAGYSIVEGYVCVPYEIYASNAGVTGLFGGELTEYDTMTTVPAESWNSLAGTHKDVFIPGAGSGDLIIDNQPDYTSTDDPTDGTTVIDPGSSITNPGDTTLIDWPPYNNDPIAGPEKPIKTPPMDVYPPVDNIIGTTDDELEKTIVDTTTTIVIGDSTVSSDVDTTPVVIIPIDPEGSVFET